MKVQCRNCNRYIDLEYFDLHYGKCSSAKYIQDKMKKLYDEDIKASDLLRLSETEFQGKYFWVLNRVYETTEDKIEKKLLENVLYGTNKEFKNIV